MAATNDHGVKVKGPQSRRAKLGRRTFVVGSVGFVLVGALHTAVHFGELAGEELEQRFNELGDIEVNGTIATSWNLFQGVSWLMGLFSIALGLASLSALRAAQGRPPLGTCLTNMAMLGAVVVVGVAHLGPLQIYGGLFGMAMFAIAAVAGRTQAAGTVSPL